MLPSGLEDGLNPYVFPHPFDHEGDSVLSGPLYLGSLHARLDKCAQNIAKMVRRNDVLTHADLSFLQVFIGERFPSLAPKPKEFLMIK